MDLQPAGAAGGPEAEHGRWLYRARVGSGRRLGWSRPRQRSGGRRGDRRRRGAGAAVLPGEHAKHSSEDNTNDYRPAPKPGKQRPAPAQPQRLGDERRLRRPPGDAGAELVPIAVRIETEELGVGAQEALRIRISRQQLKALLLQRAQITPMDMRRLLDLLQVEPPAAASL